MIKSTVQLGQMSAAQRLDEVFGLPEGSAVIVLNDPETKVPIAIMDGTLISAIRTGAVTGVCAKYMAPSRSKTVGLFGAGPQCKTQLMALKASLPQLEKAYVYDLSRESGKICGGDVAKAEHGRAGGERPPCHDRKQRHPCDRDDRDRADHPRRGDQKGAFTLLTLATTRSTRS